MLLACSKLIRRIAVAKYRLFVLYSVGLYTVSEGGSHWPVHGIYHRCSHDSAPHCPTGNAMELLAETKS